MQVAEKFVSINGEGAHAGELAVFVRFKGCNLCCSYCDTQWANRLDAVFQEETPQALTEWVTEQRVNNVTLTGGEPLLQSEIADLTERLLNQKLRVEIETNGSVSLEPFARMNPRPVFTMDYKLPSSGMESRMNTDNFSLLRQSDTVKFVTGSIKDLEAAQKIIQQYDLAARCHVYLSPVFGKIEPSRMVEYMIQNNMNQVRLQLQLHKFIWQPDARGV